MKSMRSRAVIGWSEHLSTEPTLDLTSRSASGPTNTTEEQRGVCINPPYLVKRVHSPGRIAHHNPLRYPASYPQHSRLPSTRLLPATSPIDLDYEYQASRILITRRQKYSPAESHFNIRTQGPESGPSNDNVRQSQRIRCAVKWKCEPTRSSRWLGWSRIHSRTEGCSSQSTEV